MSRDLGRALHDITDHAGRAAGALDVERLRARSRRRRTRTVTARSVGALAAVGAVVATATLAGGRSAPLPADLPVPGPTVTASPEASPSTPAPQPTTPVAGWVPGGAPCGVLFRAQTTDSPEIEVQGGVVVGTLDRATAGFRADPAGSQVFVDVLTTSEVPGLPAGDGLSRLTTMLVAPDDTVVFWDDPARELPQAEATDGSGASSMYGLYDAVDCRTGRPLTGTYRAFASDAGGPEMVELAPVTFGPDATAPVEGLDELLPVCGEPAPPGLLAGTVAADFTVSLDPGVALDRVRAAGLHVPVTVTATGPDRLSGRVPQSLRAVLVDADGVVVTHAVDPMQRRFDSGATFDTGPGESFPAELFQWFSSCPAPDAAGDTPPGSYDLVVYDVLVADDSTGKAAPRVAVGGPFPITLR